MNNYKKYLFALLICTVTKVAIADPAIAPIDLVKPLVGTSNSRWMLFPGATKPMGMVKLSPDNQSEVWNGGYEYTVGSIYGFSFFHHMSINSFSVMPVVGDLEHDPTSSKFHTGSSDGPFGKMWTSGYRSRIDKQLNMHHLAIIRLI